MEAVINVTKLYEGVINKCAQTTLSLKRSVIKPDEEAEKVILAHNESS